MNPRLDQEVLHRLRRQIDGAIHYLESGLPYRDMTPSEHVKYLKRCRAFHFVVGDFAIRDLASYEHKHR